MEALLLYKTILMVQAIQDSPEFTCLCNFATALNAEYNY